MTHQPSISLCLIVRNEERFLQACIDSARALVDEVVIVDTGSTDGTGRIANRLADVVLQRQFTGDFSASRNIAIDAASCDWILFLDADEVLVESQIAPMRNAIRTADGDLLAYSLLRFNFFATGEFYTGEQTRLFRNGHGVRYERRINESIKQSVHQQGGAIVKANAFFNHVGHCRPLHERDAKAARYMQLMRQQLDEAPNDRPLLGYLALNLRMLGRFSEARAMSDISIEGGTEEAGVWFFRGHVLRATGEPKDALDAFRRASELAPGAAAFHNMVGVMELTLGELARADNAFQDAWALDGRYLPAIINRGLVRQFGRDWPGAAELYESVAEKNPGFLVDEMDGRTEVDCFRALYNETIFRFAGLGYHLAYCRHQASDPFPVINSRPGSDAESSASSNMNHKREGFEL